MLMLRVLGLLVSIAATRAAPIASIHVKFVSPPHSYEHGITTDGGNTIAQKSFLSVGRRSSSKGARQFGERILEHRQYAPQDGYQSTSSNRIRGRIAAREKVESLWPVGVFFAPIDVNDLGFSSRDSQHMTPDFSDGLEHPDPLLLTGEEAMLAVKYIYGRGELFYDDYPHVRALLKHQEERRLNGLQGHILSSLRTDSPFNRNRNNQQ